MNYAVIDVGSNSVRILFTKQGKKQYKDVKITRLAEDLAKTKLLKKEAVDRTALAVKGFVERAKADGADKVFVFATAAVREAENGFIFVNAVKSLCGIDVDVISGEEEADLGILGALKNNDGIVIDMGGASTEIVAKQNGKITYSHSLPLGTVKLFDACSDDADKLTALIKEKIKEYGDIPEGDFYGIGGTVTSISALNLNLKEYDSDVVDQSTLCKSDIDKVYEFLKGKTLEERKQIKVLHPLRAEVIFGGACFLKILCEEFGINKITVSESDNLEGYLIKKYEKE